MKTASCVLRVATKDKLQEISKTYIEEIIREFWFSIILLHNICFY